jgi:hypothetical protein
VSEIRKPRARVAYGFDQAKGAEPGNSLLPMLVSGLVLIVVGAIVVMAFV